MKILTKEAGSFWLVAMLVLIASTRLPADDAPKKSPPDITADDSSSETTGLTKIAPGEYTVFFIVKGKLRAMGSNRCNEGGVEPNVTLTLPAKSIKAPDNVKFVDAAACGYQSCGLDDKGQVWTWGANEHGELGNGTTDKELHLPAKIETDAEGKPFNEVKSVVAGFHFFAAIKNDGSVWIWGLAGDDKVGVNASGLLGNGDKSSQAVTRPTKVTLPDSAEITQLSAGVQYLLALDKDGNVWSWGGDEKTGWERGTGSDDGSVPKKLKLPPVKLVTAGGGCNYAIDKEGNLWGWGREGVYMGLGDEKNTYHPVPTPVKLDFPDLNGRVIDVEVSQLSTHVIRDDKTLWGWGSSAMGEVGDGTINDWANAKVPYCWDWGKYEKLILKPVKVLDDVKSLYASPEGPYVFAVKTDGTIWSWGRNKTGVLANGMVPPSNEAASQPNKWDVAKPTQVNPF